MPEDRTEQLRKIKEEVLNLKESPLYQERVKNGVFPVIGEGNHQASIMFIGEAPGRNEAKTGRPFCGAAGKLLDQMLASVGIQRNEVYITNIVKDRPPMNRDPLPEEIAVYGPYLDRQIEVIQPKVVVTLGRFSMDYIMRKFNLGAQITSISRMHGQTFSADFPYGQVTVIPLYHPAVAIYNQSSKEILMEDFKILKKFN
ncbi:MAG TPA: uracil-DNA glycosylase [Candidatus Paceibacterota bacterium]|nr:uracil-DNA glycosylase [Candidatus Paceibacterota bacterium]